jgi:molybdopterin synthase sulfur carrier subunit
MPSAAEGTAARKSVRVLFYAALREAAGRSEECVQSVAATAAELYDEIAGRYRFPFPRSVLRVALNDRIEPWSARISDGDTVVFLAPFAGG